MKVEIEIKADGDCCRKNSVQEISLLVKKFRVSKQPSTLMSDKKAFLVVWKKLIAPSLTYKKAKKKHFYEIVSFVTNIKKLHYVGVTIHLSEFIPDNTLFLVNDKALTISPRPCPSHYQGLV